MNIIIKPSSKKEKKYDAVIDGSKTVSFGAKGYKDYTMHKDEERKQRYINRHKKNEQWDNPKTPGFWSKWLLWEKPTLNGAISNLNKQFKNINVKLHK